MPESKSDRHSSLRSAARQLASRVRRPGKLEREGAHFTGRIILDLSIRGGRVESATAREWKALGAEEA